MARNSMKLTANGALPVSLGWMYGLHKLEITGGPFDAFEDWRTDHPDAYGVCVRAETVPASADVNLPIRDFDVPKNDAMTAIVIRRALAAALDGKPVFVGCLGGWGRTGLFLALLAKVCGAHDPVGYVREHYTPRAVETKEQQAYVDEFDVSKLRSWLLWASWSARFLPGTGASRWT